MRIRITFSKTIDMRYTSHLDLHRAWERTLRRAKLPLTYSQGFNPHPKINLASALPLGFTSECEIVEFWLDYDIPLDKIEIRIRETVPPGIKIHIVEEISPNTHKIPNLVDSAVYTVDLLEPVPDLDQRVVNILSAKHLFRERRNKQYDLRPLIESISISSTDIGYPSLIMRLSARTGATGRPEEALLALEIDPFTTRIHRKAIIIKTYC